MISSQTVQTLIRETRRQRDSKIDLGRQAIRQADTDRETRRQGDRQAVN